MNILLVDDHPMTVEGFMSALMQVNFAEKKAVFTKAHDAKEGYHSIIEASETFHPYNLAIIDQSLPGYPEQSIASGSDLALLLREKMPNCKIIIVTAHTEVVVVYEIAKNIRPDGLIIKNDINPDNLPLIVTEVLQGKQYQSPMVKNCIQEIWRKELMIEDSNRQILLCLSRGFKIKELESIVNLTSSAIQKRIIRMKKAFDVTDDTGLIKEAVKQGFI